MPGPVVLERLDCLRRIEVPGEGDAVGAHSLIGRAALLTGRAAHDAVLVIALPGALTPAQTPDVGDAVAGIIDRGLQPGVPGLVHRPALNGLRRLEPGGIGHVLVVEHERAALHDRWRVEGAVERPFLDRLRHPLGELFLGVVVSEGDDRLVVGVVLDVRAVGQRTGPSRRPPPPRSRCVGKSCSKGTALNSMLTLAYWGSLCREGFGHLLQRDQRVLDHSRSGTGS